MAGEVRLIKIGLGLLLAIYAVLGSAYALTTPVWQNPDEPAHYNYVKHLAQGEGLPILQPGDYDQRYLEELKAARFPADMPVDRLGYEFHQPPLYYALGVPIYWAAQSWPGSVVGLRLFSLFLGGLVLVMAFRIVARVFSPGLGLTVVALMALIPQHLAVSAAVSNDALAELIMVVGLGLLIGPAPSWQRGVVMGVALLTKTSALPLLVLFPVAEIVERGGPTRWREWLGRVGAGYGMALVVGGWWLVRNIWVYGGGDLLGLARHDAVVAGQPQPTSLNLGLAVTAFKSFWAQFGWMALPADDRTYTLIATVTALAALGFLLFLTQALKTSPFSQKQALGLLVLALLLVAGGMVWYNLHFIQPQGRYLFPALLSLAVFFSLGLRELFRPRYWPVVASLFYIGLVALNIHAITQLIPQLAP